MLQQIKKVLAILLAVCFMATVTAGAVSAHADDNVHYKQVTKPVTTVVKKPVTTVVKKPVTTVVKKPTTVVKKPVTKPAPEPRP